MLHLLFAIRLLCFGGFFPVLVLVLPSKVLSLWRLFAQAVYWLLSLALKGVLANCLHLSINVPQNRGKRQEKTLKIVAWGLLLECAQTFNFKARGMERGRQGWGSEGRGRSCPSGCPGAALDQPQAETRGRSDLNVRLDQGGWGELSKISYGGCVLGFLGFS